MYGLFYTAIDIAFILQDLKLGCREESKVLDSIWENEKSLLSEQYRDNKRKFLLDIYQWGHYILDKDAIDKELVAIQRDLKHSDRTLQLDQLSGYFSDFDIFFKSCRIKILYGGINYVSIKLRTLLERYGYKRRSSLIVQYIKHCLLFYKLKVTLFGGYACDIETVDLDEILMFRIIS
jgi:hypothetical protein